MGTGGKTGGGGQRRRPAMEAVGGGRRRGPVMGQWFGPAVRASDGAGGGVQQWGPAMGDGKVTGL